MLVLTRKTDERIQIGDNITITILRVKGHAVKVGIEAPEGVQVVRCELLGRPARTGLSASRKGEAPSATAHQGADSAEETEGPADPLSGPALRRRRPRGAPPLCRRRGARRAVMAGIAACWAV